MSYILGKMDDVLDNICPIHCCGSVYRYVSLLVSDLFLMLSNIKLYSMFISNVPYEWLHHFVCLVQDSFLL